MSRPRPLIRRLAAPGLLRDALVVAGGSAGSRVLGLLFSVLLARLLSNEAFGFARYALNVAAVATIVSAAAPAAMAQAMARSEADAARRNALFTNGLVIQGGLLAATLAVTAPVLMWLGTFDWGTLVAVVGLTLFFTYLSVLRGMADAPRISLLHLLTNMLQIGLLILLVGVLAPLTARAGPATLALAGYGVASAVVVAGLEATRRGHLRFRWSDVSPTPLRQLWRFAAPMIVANGAYTLWFALDLLLLAPTRGLDEAGRYAAVKTLAQAFLIVPSAIHLVLMPLVARRGHIGTRSQIRRAIGAAAASSAILLLGTAVAGEWTLGLLFGHRYLGGDSQTVLLILAAGMALYAIHLVLESFLVGLGRPSMHAQAMLAAVAVMAGLGHFMVPEFGAAGAAGAFSLSALAGFSVIAVNAVRAVRAEVAATPPPAAAAAEATSAD